ERFGVGFAYRAEARAEVDLSLTVENLPVEIPPIRMNGIVQYTPHAMALEGHYRFGDFLGVAHLTYRRFSTFPGLVSSTTEHSPSPPAPGFRDTVSPRAALEWSTSNAR